MRSWGGKRTLRMRTKKRTLREKNSMRVKTRKRRTLRKTLRKKNSLRMTTKKRTTPTMKTKKRRMQDVARG